MATQVAEGLPPQRQQGFSLRQIGSVSSMTAVHATDVSLPSRRRRTKPRAAAQGGGLRHWRHRERENTTRLRAGTRGPWAIHLPASFCGASSTGAWIGCGASLARPTVPMSVGQERGTWNPRPASAIALAADRARPDWRTQYRAPRIKPDRSRCTPTAALSTSEIAVHDAAPLRLRCAPDAGGKAEVQPEQEASRRLDGREMRDGKLSLGSTAIGQNPRPCSGVRDGSSRTHGETQCAHRPSGIPVPASRSPRPRESDFVRHALVLREKKRKKYL